MLVLCRPHSPMRLLFVLLSGVLAVPTAVAFQPQTSDGELPLLLRADVPGQPETSVVLQREFELKSGFQQGEVRLLADFCSVEVAINGEVVCDVAAYGPTVTRDVTDQLLVGRNTIRLRITTDAAPHAFAFALSAVAADQSLVHVSADTDWQTSPAAANVQAAGLVPAQFWRPGDRAVELAATDNYQQWKQSSRSVEEPLSATTVQQPRLRIRDGFQINLIRSAEPDEGSWVSMAFDPAGRLAVAREDQGLLRFTLRDDKQGVDHVEVIDAELQECRGLLYAHGSLYANANNSKAFYRLTDTDGDDAFDQTQLLRESAGGVGHGRNDLALGPDGWIWAIHGDSVDPPSPDQADDLTSPLRDSAKGPPLREGHVVRMSPDGSQAELVCSGLRNPFGIAFNSSGDAFTYDADNEYDMGSPWYRGTRVWQLFPGSDFGWRITQGSWPPYFTDRADNAVAVLETGKGSPTAIMFGDQLRFPPPWNQCLYVLDWAYGRVLAVHLTPRGATYRSAAEVFLQGIPLNVTDLAAGPDGALYLITGGRRTQSALYRVTATANSQQDSGDTEHSRGTLRIQDEWQAYAAEMRAEVHAGERFLRERSAELAPAAVAWSIRNFSRADPHLRTLAHTVIEREKPELWISSLMRLEAVHPFHEGALSVARAATVPQLQQLLRRLAVLSASQNADRVPAAMLLRMISVRLQIVQQLWTEHPELFGTEDVPAYADWLEAELRTLNTLPWCVSVGDTLPAVRRRVAAAMGEAQSIHDISTVVPMLQSSDQQDQLAALLALRKHIGNADDHLVEKFLLTLNAGERYLGGDGMSIFLQRIRDDAAAAMTEQQRSSMAALLSPQPAAMESTPPRAPLHRYTMNDLVSLFNDNAVPGNPARGAAIFREALCVRCHRYQSEGFAYGPDLTWVARRFSRQDLCRSILHPSEVVAEPWQMAQVVTSDGRVESGRIVARGDYRSESLLLNTEPLNPAALIEIDKKDIDELNYVSTSPMPERLLDGFSLDEIRDLLSYLEIGNLTAAEE